jgi:hypothetical protein
MENSGAKMEAEMRTQAQGQLRARSGTLFKSIYHKTYERGTDTVVSKTGVRRRAFYGAFFEKGVPRKVVEVKGYVHKGRKVRGVKDVELKQSAGGTVSTGKVRRGVVAQQVSFVQSFRKAVEVPRRPFVSPAYQRLKSSIEADIAKAVRKGAE